MRHYVASLSRPMSCSPCRCTALLDATVHRLGVQSRRPRTLPFNLADYPPVHFREPTRKTAAQGPPSLHSWVIVVIQIGWRAAAAMGHLLAGVRQLPYRVVVVALILPADGCFA